MRALVVVSACLLSASVGWAASPTLGSLEAEALATALSSRGLVVDPAPDGKIIGQVHVVNLDVFQPQDGRYLGFLNYFHRTTREHHIRRESLLIPGMAYTQHLVDETVRNFRSRSASSADDLGLSALVIATPVRSQIPERVDLLIVTRDLWSLRLNTDFDHQGGSLIRLVTSISENNFLGYRKRLSLVLDMDQGKANVGPNYVDPNVLGSRVRFLAAFYGVWARRLGEVALGAHEGTSGRVRVEYPLFSLASRYGGFLDGSYFDGVDRRFFGSSIKTIRPAQDKECLASTGISDPTAVDCAFRLFDGGVSSGFTRSFPSSWLIQRITLGHELGIRRTGFVAGFTEDLSLRQNFSTKVFPRSYQTSGIYLRYDLFTPQYRVYHHLDTFDLGEDFRSGPYVILKVRRSAEFLGSDRSDTYSALKVQWNATAWGGFQTVGAAWDGVLYGDEVRDQLTSIYLRLVTPILWRTLRLIGDGSLVVQTDNEFRLPYVIGGKEGLRGYPVNAFGGGKGASSIYYVAHLEARSVPLSLGFLRWGGIVFADAGHAALRAGDLAFYSDVGFGLRVLIPQLNNEVIRVDWAFPLRDLYTQRQVFKAGWPGRLSLGFRQAF